VSGRWPTRNSRRRHRPLQPYAKIRDDARVDGLPADRGDGGHAGQKKRPTHSAALRSKHRRTGSSRARYRLRDAFSFGAGAVVSAGGERFFLGRSPAEQRVILDLARHFANVGHDLLVWSSMRREFLENLRQLSKTAVRVLFPTHFLGLAFRA